MQIIMYPQHVVLPWGQDEWCSYTEVWDLGQSYRDCCHCARTACCHLGSWQDLILNQTSPPKAPKSCWCKCTFSRIEPLGHPAFTVISFAASSKHVQPSAIVNDLILITQNESESKWAISKMTYFLSKVNILLIFSFIFVFRVYPGTCLHALMIKKLFIFLILPVLQHLFSPSVWNQTALIG